MITSILFNINTPETRRYPMLIRLRNRCVPWFLWWPV